MHHFLLKMFNFALKFWKISQYKFFFLVRFAEGGTKLDRVPTQNHTIPRLLFFERIFLFFISEDSQNLAVTIFSTKNVFGSQPVQIQTPDISANLYSILTVIPYFFQDFPKLFKKKIIFNFWMVQNAKFSCKYFKQTSKKTKMVFGDFWFI